MVSSTRPTGTATYAPASSKSARILAIDYGRKRIGLAISDEVGLTGQPLAAIVRKNRRTDLARLRDIVKQQGVGAILIGLPLHMSGKSSEMATEATGFAARLKNEFGLPVKLRDERLTSWEAEQMAAELGLRKNADIDSLAAAILLREYLDETASDEKSKHQGRRR